MYTITVKRSKLFCSHLRIAFKLFRTNDPLRLAGATAFFATFALPPILLILIRLFGFFVDRKTLATRIFERLDSILDESSTAQIRQTLRNIRGVDYNWWATILSFVFFYFRGNNLV